MLFKRITVPDTGRVVVTRNDHLVDILRTGKHTLFVPPFGRVETEWHSLLDPLFESSWADYVVTARPDIVAEHFRILETSDREIAFVSVSGELRKVVLPRKQLLLWKEAEHVTVDLVNVVDAPEAPERMLPEFERLGAMLKTPVLALSDPRDDDGSSHGGIFDVFSFDDERHKR
jgi:hypothetical protein